MVLAAYGSLFFTRIKFMKMISKDPSEDQSSCAPSSPVSGLLTFSDTSLISRFALHGRLYKAGYHPDRGILEYPQPQWTCYSPAKQLQRVSRRPFSYVILCTRGLSAVRLR